MANPLQNYRIFLKTHVQQRFVVHPSEYFFRNIEKIENLLQKHFSKKYQILAFTDVNSQLATTKRNGFFISFINDSDDYGRKYGR